MPHESMVQLTCPHCQERYHVEASKVPTGGGWISCRICGEKVPVSYVPALPPTSSQKDPRETCCPRCGFRFLTQRGETAETGGQKTPERQTILVVEDTSFFLELARGVLEKRYRILSARSPSEAVAALRSERVDLMLLDLTLQTEGDGVKILEAFPRKPCPVLVYTSREEQDLLGAAWEELRRAGADDLLVKGMNVEDEMMEKVSRLLATQREPAYS